MEEKKEEKKKYFPKKYLEEDKILCISFN